MSSYSTKASYYSSLNLPNISSHQIRRDYKFQSLIFEDPDTNNNNTNEDEKDFFHDKPRAKEDQTTDLIPPSLDKENFDKIPLSILIFYSLPSFGKMSCLVLLNVHAMLYYESIGASLVYMSFFVTLARGLEILLKPIIAHLSDELRTSLGRRKPFMIAGCGFYALFLILLFSPPSMKTITRNISIWFGVFYVLFFMAETVTNVPYLALGPELSANSKQREKLYFFFYVFQYIGVLFAAAAPVVLNRLFYSCDCSFCYENPLITDIEKCLLNCQIMCNVKSNQTSLFTLSLLIGVLFVLSIGLLSWKISERSESFNTDKMEFIPSLYELINNKPFVSLIIPWILDTTIMTIFSTMLPFFLNIIINPQKYCIDNNIPLQNLECSVNIYLGVTISIFFICCIGFCSVWHYLVSKFGKRKCWQYYSLLAIVPFLLFLFCDVGSTNILIISAVLTAFPTGGAYLTDVLVSDTIDYDEFYTGKRNEGIFTVCTAFIPKFVSLFAQAIPLSLMSFVGFVPSENGIVHDQPYQVKLFIKLFFSFIPIIIAILSFICKMHYPIRNDGVMFQVRQGIELQKDRIERLRSASFDYYKIMDPVYRRSHINIVIKTEEERLTKNLADHFGNVEHLVMIYNGQLDKIANKMKGTILITFVMFIGGLVLLFYTFGFLSDQKFSFIPITALFLISFMLIYIALYFMKFQELKKAMNEEYKINQKMMRLIIYMKVKNDLHSEFKIEKKFM